MSTNKKNLFTSPLTKHSMFNQIGDPDETLKGLPRGEVGVLLAPGATGKSYFCMNLMLSSINLVKNHLIDEEKDIKILYVSLEDAQDDINRRLINYKDALQIQNQNVLKISNNDFEVITYKGAQRLINKGIAQNTNPLWNELRDKIKCSQSDLVIIDTLIKTYDGYEENSNGDMSMVLSYFNELSIECKCSILLLHHTNKGAIKSEESSQADCRGASSIVDNSRYVISLRKNENDSAVICKGIKTNFIKLQDATYRRKYKGALLLDEGNKNVA